MHNHLRTEKRIVAVFSDIHSNYHAFKACYDDAIKYGADSFVFLGDYVSDLAEPRKTMDLVYEIQSRYPTICLRGNREGYMLDCEKGASSFSRGSKSGSLLFTYNHLREKDLDFFRGLKISDTIEISGVQIEIAHASMDNDRYYFDCSVNFIPNLIAANAANYGVPQKRERVILVGFRKDLNIKFEFPDETNVGNWVPLSVAVPKLAIEEQKYYFSEKAVQGMKNAKNNMKRGLAQDLSQPCLTVTSHLAKVSLNSRDPVLLVDPEKELYRRFTPREAARIQSFPDSFRFAGSETDAYRQIGNAVPPVLLWHIGNKVAHYLMEKTDATSSNDNCSD